MPQEGFNLKIYKKCPARLLPISSHADGKQGFCRRQVGISLVVNPATLWRSRPRITDHSVGGVVRKAVGEFPQKVQHT